MIIRRIQVEGGFLDGLNLRFDEGLNVLIGGRGTGKSSVIELIRYCLNVRGYSDEEDAKRSLEQALSVLQDGQVTLELEHRGNDFIITRSANADPEGLDHTIVRPLIFSQKDVESVGLSVRGRLNIIDFFSAQSSVGQATERKQITQTQSLTTEIRGLLREADQISDRLAGADSVRAELARAEARVAEISKTSRQLDEKQKQLEALSSQTAVLTVKTDTLRRALETISGYRDQIGELRLFGLSVDEWPEGAGEVDLLQQARTKLAKADRHIEETYTLIETSISEIETAIKVVEREKAPLEEQARVIRREIDGLKEGAGAAARQLGALREQVSQLSALGSLKSQKLDRAARVQQQRSKLLDDLEALRDARSAERQDVAQMLTGKLAPLIRIKIRQSAQLSEFVGAISSGLRGSGLRYNELSSALASREIDGRAQVHRNVSLARVDRDTARKFGEV